MPVPPLLDELLRAHGASGFEDDVQAIVRRECAALGAEVAAGVLGTTVATLKGTSGRLIALFAHADQVALTVQRAGDDGLLVVTQTSHWAAADAWRQRVRIRTASGEIPGVVVGQLGEGGPAWSDVRVDIGATTREDALEVVRPGDPIVLDGAPVELRNGRVMATAFDDRAGIYACLEALRRLALDPPAWDVALVVSTQEESGSYPGARTAAEGLRPEVALVLEVTYADDAPGQKAWGEIPLGGGPAIFRGPVVSPLVSDGLIEVAAAHEVPFSLESGQGTSSDADGLYAVGDGVACGLISIPLRYMHSAAEVAQLSDLEAAAVLVEQYVRSLADDASFLR